MQATQATNVDVEIIGVSVKREWEDGSETEIRVTKDTETIDNVSDESRYIELAYVTLERAGDSVVIPAAMWPQIKAQIDRLFSPPVTFLVEGSGDAKSPVGPIELTATPLQELSDQFDPIEDRAGFAFPCHACKHSRTCADTDLPCALCKHNLNCVG